MEIFTVFRRVPGNHPRWHAQTELRARSRPDALRRAGHPTHARQPGTIDGASLYMAHRTDRIDFDYRALDGAIITTS